MASIFLSESIAPTPELEPSPSDNNEGGTGGGIDGPDHDPPHSSELPPKSWAPPLGAYRMITLLAIIWIVTLFATLTLVLESRWVHSSDWVSISLPNVLYLNTAFLLLSSLAIEMARFSLRTEGSKRSIRWIFATLLLGLAFVGGQLVAWRELGFRGLHLASNPGSFFFYLITGAHGLHFLGGMASLACVGVFVSRMTQKVKQQKALDVITLYWHFMDGLWLYLLALLFITLQK